MLLKNKLLNFLLPLSSVTADRGGSTVMYKLQTEHLSEGF
jgi:hypothetical protein